jgi:hypothetical protein
MKLTALVVAAAAALMFAPSAHAREHYYHHSHHTARHIYYARSHYRIYARSHSGRNIRSATGWTSRELAYSSRTSYRDRGRPAAWCGWEMRRLVGADPGPSYNLARNWAHWGRPGPVGVGAVVVWAHHVGKIVGRENGQWVIESGNDGHALRTRPRSIAGAIAIRWG